MAEKEWALLKRKGEGKFNHCHKEAGVGDWGMASPFLRWTHKSPLMTNQKHIPSPGSPACAEHVINKRVMYVTGGGQFKLSRLPNRSPEVLPLFPRTHQPSAPTPHPTPLPP